jgi:hypothetical protein
VCRSHVIRHRCLFVYPATRSPTPTYLLTVRMSVERTELEKSFKEVLKKFMADKAMFERIQASSTRGLQASPSTGHRSSRVNPATENRIKHRDDMANAKQIPLVLPD